MLLVFHSDASKLLMDSKYLTLRNEQRFSALETEYGNCCLIFHGLKYLKEKHACFESNNHMLHPLFGMTIRRGIQFVLCSHNKNSGFLVNVAY